MRGPPTLFEPLSNSIRCANFQLPKLRHKFLTSKSTLKVDVIKLVLWENKISFKEKMASLVKPMTDSDIIWINNEH